MFLPQYLQLKKSGELDERAETLNELLQACELCPFACKINRLDGEFGVCNAGFEPEIKSAHANFGEIPELVGKYGCGYISFKQELIDGKTISTSGECREFEIDELAKQMVNLQIRGCNNISFVTPTNFTAQIIEAISLAVEGGFMLPIAWNCTGFESEKVLKLLSGIADIYIVDFQRITENIVLRRKGMHDVIYDALFEIFAQINSLEYDARGILNHGVIIRNLSLVKGWFDNHQDIFDLVEERHKANQILFADSNSSPS